MLFKQKYLWFVIGNYSLEEENISDMFRDIQLRLDTNLQMASPKNSNIYDVYEIYKLGIGVKNTIKKIAKFSENNLQHINRGNSFYESRKDLTNVLLRTGNTVCKYF